MYRKRRIFGYKRHEKKKQTTTLNETSIDKSKKLQNKRTVFNFNSNSRSNSQDTQCVYLLWFTLFSFRLLPLGLSLLFFFLVPYFVTQFSLSEFLVVFVASIIWKRYDRVNERETEIDRDDGKKEKSSRLKLICIWSFLSSSFFSYSDCCCFGVFVFTNYLIDLMLEDRSMRRHFYNWMSFGCPPMYVLHEHFIEFFFFISFAFHLNWFACIGFCVCMHYFERCGDFLDFI